MATFPTAPGIHITELDLTTIVPSVSTTDGAIVGYFNWGPVDDITLISNQDTLAKTFGKPSRDANGAFFWSASNFLDYSNRIHVMRVSDGGNATWDGVAVTVKNDDEYVTKFDAGTIGTPYFVAKHPGSLGNSIKVSVVDGPAAFANTIAIATSVDTTKGNTMVDFSGHYADGAADSAVAAGFSVGDIITFGGFAGWGATVNDNPTGEYKVTALSANVATLSSPLTSTSSGTSVFRRWEFYHNFDLGPETSEFALGAGKTDDEMHIIITDEKGAITGVPGTVLERYPHVSKASDALDAEGKSQFYKEVIDRTSRYIRVSRYENNWGNSTTDLSGSTFNVVGATMPYSNTLTGGTDAAPTNALLQTGWQRIADADSREISLLISGAAASDVVNRQVVEVAQARKDCLGFISPLFADVVGLTDQETISTAVIDHRDNELAALNSSYGVMDSGWKYQFDKYNNTYRWTPLNADLAGLCARTDDVRDSWWSPAGFQRGNIKNVVKLAWNPTGVFREELYKHGINPVVTFPGQGTVLYGDKTLLTRPSAFDRINVRRLFIVLEKAISRAAQYSLFEFNDTFTRSQFRNMIEPFLRDIQGRQGVYDFRVVCDETNNTGEVIDRNEFVGDIYIKPARSINFIQLNFIVARSGVDFTEITGR